MNNDVLEKGKIAVYIDECWPQLVKTRKGAYKNR
jgi:hypothetical protein